MVKDASGDPIGLPAGPCHVTYIESKCTGILQGDGGAPINATEDAGWSLAMLTRMSFNDVTNGDVTVIDFPLTAAYGDPSNGQIKLDTSTAELLSGILTVVSNDDADLPTCTTLQTLEITLEDPAGLPFATIGVSTRAKDEWGLSLGRLALRWRAAVSLCSEQADI